MSETKIKHQVVTFDQAAYDDMTLIQNRRAELSAQLGEINGMIRQAQSEIADQVVKGGDPFELSKRLAELKGAAEALEAGVKCLEDRASVILRSNVWMRR